MEEVLYSSYGVVRCCFYFVRISIRKTLYWIKRSIFFFRWRAYLYPASIITNIILPVKKYEEEEEGGNWPQIFRSEIVDFIKEIYRPYYTKGKLFVG